MLWIDFNTQGNWMVQNACIHHELTSTDFGVISYSYEEQNDADVFLVIEVNQSLRNLPIEISRFYFGVVMLYDIYR